MTGTDASGRAGATLAALAVVVLLTGAPTEAWAQGTSHASVGLRAGMASTRTR